MAADRAEQEAGWQCLGAILSCWLQAMIGRFLIMLTQHTDSNLKSLSARIDFNETYKSYALHARLLGLCPLIVATPPQPHLMTVS